jgi:transcriptional regulator with XRE-family HTH domain
MVRRSKYDTDFGASVSKSLAEARLTQSGLAERTGQSPAYINQVITGRKKPSPQWIDMVANALNLSERERVHLHRQAAKAHGFTLDLTKK